MLKWLLSSHLSLSISTANEYSQTKSLQLFTSKHLSLTLFQNHLWSLHHPLVSVFKYSLQEVWRDANQVSHIKVYEWFEAERRLGSAKELAWVLGEIPQHLCEVAQEVLHLPWLTLYNAEQCRKARAKRYFYLQGIRVYSFDDKDTRSILVVSVWNQRGGKWQLSFVTLSELDCCDA